MRPGSLWQRDRRSPILDNVMMRLLFTMVVLIPGAVPYAEAAPTPAFPSEIASGGLCSGEAARLAGDWKATGPWEAGLPTDQGAVVMLSPTRTIGVWLEAHRHPDGRLELLRVTPRTTTALSWSGDCTPALRVIRRTFNEKKLAKAFTDADFRKLTSDGKPGLVFVWSPHMRLSLKSHRNAQEVAKELKLPLTVVMDPSADSKLAEVRLKEGGLARTALRRAQSFELFYRGVLNHFPALVVYDRGRVVANAFPGFKTKKRYVDFIQKGIASRAEGERSR